MLSNDQADKSIGYHSELEYMWNICIEISSHRQMGGNSALTSLLAYEPLILRSTQAPVKLHNKSQEKFLLTGANVTAKSSWVPHPTQTNSR